MEVLSSRLLLRPRNLERSLDFYAGALGLPVYREFGAGRQYGVVFFTGGGYLEVSGELAPGPKRGTTTGPTDSTESGPSDSTTTGPIGAGPDASGVALWLQVRDATAEVGRLAAAGVPVVRAVQREPWGLVEGWIEDPDGTRIGIVEVPNDHPLRRRVD